jgi:hypothetical protein
MKKCVCSRPTVVARTLDNVDVDAKRNLELLPGHNTFA